LKKKKKIKEKDTCKICKCCLTWSHSPTHSRCRLSFAAAHCSMDRSWHRLPWWANTINQ